MTASHESTRNPVHVHNISFSPDKSFFTVSLDEGLRVYQTEPLKLLHSVCQSELGSVRVASQLNQTCVIAAVGGGARPKVDSNTALLYNFMYNTVGAQIRVPRGIIVNILLRDERMVLVTPQEIWMYEVQMFPLKEIKFIMSHQTKGNVLGLCQMSSNAASKHVLCYPASVPGTVQIVGLSGRGGSEQSAPRSVLLAHQNSLQCLRLSSDGRLLATASSKGSLVRLWSVDTPHTKLHEFRRGIDPALIYDIDISSDNQFLACVSDKRTVHVFSILSPELNPGSNLGPPKAMASHTLHSIAPCKIALSCKGTLVVVTLDGRYFELQFSRVGLSPQCRRLVYELYTDLLEHSGAGDDEDSDGATPSSQVTAITRLASDMQLLEASQ